MSEGFVVSRRMVPRLEEATKEVFVEKVTPSVVEPSFGIGRILTALLEHSFR